MGYYTFLDLSWNVPEASEKDDEISRWLDEDDARENFEDLYPGGACGMSKNRDPDDDMIRISEAFPDVLFTLHGNGEDDTDLWKTYYRDGRLQHAPATVSYPDFDPEALVTPEPSRNPSPSPHPG